MVPHKTLMAWWPLMALGPDGPSQGINGPDGPSQDINGPDGPSQDINGPDGPSQDINGLMVPHKALIRLGKE